MIVGDLIGDGGMGVVYKGWLYYNPQGPKAGTPSHPVAIKVLHPLLTARQYVRQLFIGEATALRQLSHPNIVSFFELVEAPGQLALVIEYVDGEALDKVITRHVERSKAQALALPALPFARAWHYFEQLLGALAATHALGIVHRDVKPGNLLVRRDGFCKLTDFGIARLPADLAKISGGMQPGTGAYMSPEQVLGRNLDGRSDLYSSAIMLFEMLTGRTPFDDPDRSELMGRAAQVDETPPAITRFIPQAPPVFDLLMARALAKSPEHRFQSAIEMADSFRTALGLAPGPGWNAQLAFAKHATGIAIGAPTSTKGKTRPIPVSQANEMRNALASAYKS